MPNNVIPKENKSGKVYHLHGSISDPKTLVMTIDEYINQYRKNSFQDFIQDIMNDESYCIIFMGYGIDELELIDFLIEKTDTKENYVQFPNISKKINNILGNNSNISYKEGQLITKDKISAEQYKLLIDYFPEEKEKITELYEKSTIDTKLQQKKMRDNRFILLPTFINEESIIPYEQHYFNKLNIRIISYSIDDIGYEQLYEIIKSWNEILTEKEIGEDFYSKIEIIDNALANYNEQIKDEVLRLISADKDVLKYFFSKVSSYLWVDSLLEHFEPTTIEIDENGHTPFWIPLDYLEKVSIDLNNQPGGYLGYGKKILDVINDLVKHSKIQPINNMHIWWYVIKIIGNLPDEVLNEYLQLNSDLNNVADFKRWMETATHNPYSVDLAVHEIGEKLLPKCLNNPNLNNLTPILFDVITKPYPITINNKNKIQLDDYHVLKAFEQNIKLIGKNIKEEGLLAIINNLKLALEYHRQETKHQITISGRDYLFIVSRKPLDTGYFETDKYILEIAQYSEKNNDKLNEMIMAGIEPENFIQKPQEFTAKTKKEFISEITGFINRIDVEKTSSDFSGDIEVLYIGLSQDYSSISIKSLKEADEYLHSPEEVLSVVSKDVLNEFSKQQPEEAEKLLKKLLNTDCYPFSMFRRLVLYSISENYEPLFGLFPEVLKEEIFNDSNCEVELFDLLNEYGQKENKQYQKHNEEILKCINNVPDYYTDHENSIKMVAYWKFKWLSALRNIEDEAIQSAYKEAKKESEYKTEQYEPIRKGVQTGWIRDISPLTSEEILQKPPEEIVDFLNAFQGNDEWKDDFTRGPNKEGLQEALKQAVLEKPAHFTDKCEVFAKTPIGYIRFIIRGLTEVWKNNQEIGWTNTINFCLIIIKQDNYKNNFQEDHDAQELIKDICWLVNSGCKNDGHAFSKDLKNEVESLFTLMIDLPHVKIEPAKDDLVMCALNTVLGSIVRSYIDFSLWIFRNIEKKENWGKTYFDRFFNIGLEPYVWLGQFLLNFNYLDKKYTKEKITELSMLTIDDIKWQCFMEGYLGYSNLHSDLFAMMMPHYEKLKDDIVFDNEIEKRYIEHLAYFYLKSHFELKKGSLFYDVLMNADNTNRTELWVEVARYLWSISPRSLEDKKNEPLPSEVVQRILEFWEWTIKEKDIIKILLGETYNKFISQMGQLLIYVEKLEETQYNWMMESIPHLEEHHQMPFVIEYMTSYDSLEKGLAYVGKLFIELLKTATPSYKKENIQLIVRRLYENGLKEMADEICTTYGRRGNHFLRDLFDEFNP